MEEFYSSGKAVRAIMNLIETGSVAPQYDKYVVLGDRAGVTAGRNQTTENSGGLHALISMYVDRVTNEYSAALRPYLDILYRRGGSTSDRFKVTHDPEFKRAFLRAAQEDLEFRKVQDAYFYRDYFSPAQEYSKGVMSFETGMGLLLCYDTAIQSGASRLGAHWDAAARRIPDPFVHDCNNFLKHVPNELDMVDQFHESVYYHLPRKADDLYIDPALLADDQEYEKRELIAFNEYRYRWLCEFNGRDADHTTAVRRSVYRALAYRYLMAQNKWDLVPEFDMIMNFGVVSVSERDVQTSEAA